MAIKWKGWTARRPVKVCCVILVPVMAFVFLLSVLELARMGGSLDESILFADFESSDYFFDRYAAMALDQVQTVFSYQSEENIMSMGRLKWEPSEETYIEYIEDAGGIVDISEQYHELISINMVNSWRSWGRVRASQLESQEAKAMVENAMTDQLNEYRYAKEWLDTTGGLYYFALDGNRSLTNAPGQDENFYRQQPVYIIESGHRWEQSRKETYSFAYSGYWESADDRTIYIAFTQEAVDYQNSLWKNTQRQTGANAALMVGSALVTLILLIILIAGSGRRYGDNSGAVHFTVLDKPWLDFGLVALIGYEVAACCFLYFSLEVAWRYDNIRWIVALLALLAVGFTLPLLGWVLSFTKRCKAGKWWRNTLLYWIYDKCRRFIKSLWAGFPLTAKAILIGISSIAAMLFSVAAPPMCLVFAAVATFLLLRYARRLHLVEKGAKAAGNGQFTPIAVTGGELGSIAFSINRISDGINVAVTERMKSERLKTELITNVSHDIRTPLTSLITYTDLLKNEGLDCEKAPEYLEVLIQKSARLKTLTDDLFEASKAASGNIEVHLEALDLADFVRQVLGELDERVSASGLDFRLNLPEHAPVRADGRLLWRVMENLLSNVFKYAMTNSRVYIDITPENGEYRLEVKNISEYPLNLDPAELTERFKRGDSARTDEGSGLGLSIAQSFIQAQDGRFALSIDGDLFKATIYLAKEGHIKKSSFTT